MPTDVNFKTIEYNFSVTMARSEKKLIMIFTHNLKCDPRDENYYALNFIFQSFSPNSRAHLQSRVFVSNDLKTNRGGLSLIEAGEKN
jgi:hypothetical protein